MATSFVHYGQWSSLYTVNFGINIYIEIYFLIFDGISKFKFPPFIFEWLNRFHLKFFSKPFIYLFFFFGSCQTQVRSSIFHRSATWSGRVLLVGIYDSLFSPMPLDIYFDSPGSYQKMSAERPPGPFLPQLFWTQSA